MPDPVSRKKHKKKVLERWENEGGMIPDKPVETLQNRSRDKRETKGDAARTSQRLTAKRPKGRRNKRDSV